MANPRTLLEEGLSLKVFEELLLKNLKNQDGIIHLKDIPQWIGFLNSIGLLETPLCSARTLLLGGYFYNFTTPVPTEKELVRYLKLGDRKEIDYYLIPTVRESEDDKILSELGFYKIPSYIESIFEIQSDVDKDILSRLKRAQYKAIKKYNEKSHEDYTFEIYDHLNITSNEFILSELNFLHEHNVKKYGHKINLYDYQSLSFLAHSPIGKNLLIFIRRDKETNIVTQGHITFISEKYGHIYIMAQGKDEQKIKPGNNLYIATFYEIFLFAQTHKFSQVHLGRGGQQVKKKCGANKFYVLNNWIKPNKNNLISHVKLIKDKSNYLNFTNPTIF